MVVVGGRKEFCLELESVLETIMLWFMPTGILHNNVLLMKLPFISCCKSMSQAHGSLQLVQFPSWRDDAHGDHVPFTFMSNSLDWWHGECIRNGLQNVPSSGTCLRSAWTEQQQLLFVHCLVTSGISSVWAWWKPPGSSSCAGVPLLLPNLGLSLPEF